MQAVPFFMFQGDANKALALWQEAFPEIEVLDMKEHQDGPQVGQIAMARVRLGGTEWRLYDSPPVHDFTFTPSTSIFVNCDNEAQLRRLVDKLGEDGKVLMPLENCGFSSLFTWLVDRFGVSWQLNLP
jgi:predicted 3-demethylubiquinone-9 3-methyltransferase (glyoxalase superfamily)